MSNDQIKSRKIANLAIFLIFLTVVYGIFIHDLLPVRWQGFVDFFFYLVLLGSVFILVGGLYRRHFLYLDLTEKTIEKMSHAEFVKMVAHLCRCMGYEKVKEQSDSFFDISYEYQGKKDVIFCYHKKKLTTIPIIKNARVILITDYHLESYELDQLAGSHWKLIEHDELLRLLNEYLV
ncbi:hypothetical protein [Xylocopilactobacillus apicola]|uniref:Uncharacterized protein n=1 Tax=Xylocopilactobacillus apicola TaxID=2932184 RepID=A0AAU9DN19_9LACO|nr:hypothetical protein [Xylocopilactobacillus apicola]BDR58422.1 hypothetical protein XA3_08630 [Xylocopilactobacillus apicola]